MGRKAKKKTLSAVTLKEELWDTLHGLKQGLYDPAEADAVAGLARGILKTVDTQIRVHRAASTPLSEEVQVFADPSRPVKP